jgi:phage recombination protein Bet
MSEVTTLSVIGEMAKSWGMEKEAFEATIRQTCMPANIQVSPAQFTAFLLVAREYGLNPITKEIFAFPAKSGGIQPIVSVDGWCHIINSHPQLNGIVFEDKMDGKGKVVSITCKIYRKDRAHPVECTEYMGECNRDTQTWKQWPIRMLRHKALIQCARYAFGFSGIVEQDEAERQNMIDVTPVVQDPNTGEHVAAKPSPFKTAAARKEYCQNVQDSLKSAVTLDDLETNMELNKPTFDAMAVSKNEHDTIGLDGINIAYEMAKRRIMIATREESDADEQLEMQKQQLGEG